jgi:hypothetical protein
LRSLFDSHFRRPPQYYGHCVGLRTRGDAVCTNCGLSTRASRGRASHRRCEQHADLGRPSPVVRGTICIKRNVLVIARLCIARHDALQRLAAWWPAPWRSPRRLEDR